MEKYERICGKCSSTFTCNHSCGESLQRDSCYCPKCFEEVLLPILINSSDYNGLLRKRVKCDSLPKELRGKALILYTMQKIKGKGRMKHF